MPSRATMSCGRLFSRWFAVIACAVLPAVAARAADAETDWKEITALDAGPQAQGQSRDAARALVVSHLARQERALRGFLVAHPADARAFEARLRLARLLEIRADFEDSEKVRAEGARIVAELEKTATPEQRAEIDFARVAQLMRKLRLASPAEREQLLAAARKFQAAHPADRRLAALLAEVATLFDTQPKTKEALLTDAQRLATDDELKSRIFDDLRRLRFLGEKIDLDFRSAQGAQIRLDELRGKPVLIVFFADFSPPSTDAITTVQRALAELPRDSAHVLAISLDSRREELANVMKTKVITWPVAFDGKAWESPLVRRFGINSLPTVWLLDRAGRLRSLNALENPGAQIRQLLREP